MNIPSSCYRTEIGDRLVAKPTDSALNLILLSTCRSPDHQAPDLTTVSPTSNDPERLRAEKPRRTIRLPSIRTTATLERMTHSTADPDMQMLMAAVGEVLLTWGYVESAILDRLAALEGTATKPSKASPLSRWKNAETATPAIAEVLAEIERIADVRNCLAHGLEAASVNPDDAHAPAVTCRTADGKRHISFSTLVETRRSLRRLSHAILALPDQTRE